MDLFSKPCNLYIYPPQQWDSKTMFCGKNLEIIPKLLIIWTFFHSPCEFELWSVNCSSMLNFFRVALFSCRTFSILHCFYVALFMWLFSQVALFSYCYFCVALFSSCTCFLLRFFHVALSSVIFCKTGSS